MQKLSSTAVVATGTYTLQHFIAFKNILGIQSELLTLSYRNWKGSNQSIYPVEKANTHFSSFPLTMVDTFQQLRFVHDLHSTTNLNVALAKKLFNPVRLEWNTFVLEKEFQQQSLQILSDWLLDYSKACRNLNSSLQIFQSSHSQSSWKSSPSVQNYTSATSGWKTNQN